MPRWILESIQELMVLGVAVMMYYAMLKVDPAHRDAVIVFILVVLFMRQK